MKSMIQVANQGSRYLGVALLLGVSVFAGCGKKQTVAPPTSVTMTPEKVKMLVSLLEGAGGTGPFGVDIKASAAEQLGECGQMAKDAGAVAALNKVSKSGKSSKEAKEAAVAALAKLNGAAPAP